MSGAGAGVVAAGGAFEVDTEDGEAGLSRTGAGGVREDAAPLGTASLAPPHASISATMPMPVPAVSARLIAAILRREGGHRSLACGRMWAMCRGRATRGQVTFAAVASALALLGIAATSTAATDASVSIAFRAYQPSALTVSAGQTVTWRNSGLGPHTVTADSGQFDSEKLESGETFSYTFALPGTYLYSCTIHPTMHGKVVVLPAGSPLPGAQKVQLSLSDHGGTTVAHVHAPRPGAAVLLQLSPSGSSWHTARRAHLSPGGSASFTLAASVHEKLRVVVKGPAGKPPLISKALRA